MEKKENLEKYCYDYWKSANWNTNKLENLIGRGGIDSIKTARLLAKNYAQNIGISEENFYQEIIQANAERVPRKERKYQKIFEELSDVDKNDREKIIKIINKYQTEKYFETRRLKTFIRSYARFFREIEKVELEADLLEKIDLYSEEKREKSKEKPKEMTTEDIIHYHKIVNRFMQSNKPKQKLAKEYAEKTGISEARAYRYIQLAERLDNISQRKETIIQTKKQEKYKEIESTITIILELIKNGVPTNDDKTRKFNLLDYYTLTTLTPVEMSKIIKEKIPKQDYITFMNEILNNSEKDKKTTEEKKLKETYKVLNKEDKLIEMTEEDKKYVLNYLETNEIPLTEKTYTQAVKRYVNLELDDLKKNLENQKNKKR